MKSLPACAWSVKTGRKPTVMTRSEKKSDGPTSFAASIINVDSLSLPAVLFPFFQLLVGILHHDDRGVNHGADGDGDAGEAHDVGRHPEIVHTDEGHDDGYGKRKDDHEGAGQMEEEDEADDAHGDGKLYDLFLQRGDGADDQIGPVVRGDDFHAGRKRRLDILFDLCFDPLYDVEDIFPEPDDDDAAGDFALAVKVRNSTPYLRPELDVGYVLEVDEAFRQRLCRPRYLRYL